MSTPQLDRPSVLDQLAWDLATHGIAGQELALRQVVRAARAAGPTRVSPVAVDVLADPAEPEVVRLRAFGRVAASLATADRDSGGTGHDAAA